MGSMCPAAWAKEVSQAAFLPSRIAFFSCSVSCLNASMSFMMLSLLFSLLHYSTSTQPRSQDSPPLATTLISSHLSPPPHNYQEQELHKLQNSLFSLNF